VRAMGCHGHLHNPGDLLTLLYRFHPRTVFCNEDLLAARALIYNKLIVKEEISEGSEPYPHTRYELVFARTTAGLSWDDCRLLYPLIRQPPTATARAVVQHHLDRGSKKGPPV
jgi:hypothetical protein